MIKLETKDCFVNDAEMQGFNCNWSKKKRRKGTKIKRTEGKKRGKKNRGERTRERKRTKEKKTYIYIYI